MVTGAGVGGVASAARLAKAGFDVTVIEKNDFTGGRCSLIHHEGFVRLNLSPIPVNSFPLPLNWFIYRNAKLIQYQAL